MQRLLNPTPIKLERSIHAVIHLLSQRGSAAGPVLPDRAFPFSRPFQNSSSSHCGPGGPEGARHPRRSGPAGPRAHRGRMHSRGSGLSSAHSGPSARPRAGRAGGCLPSVLHPPPSALGSSSRPRAEAHLPRAVLTLHLEQGGREARTPQQRRAVKDAQTAARRRPPFVTFALDRPHPKGRAQPMTVLRYEEPHLRPIRDPLRPLLLLLHPTPRPTLRLCLGQ